MNNYLSDTHLSSDWFRKNFFDRDIYLIDETTSKSFTLEGKNNKSVLVIAAAHKEELEASSLDQLTKIMSFLKLSMEDIHLMVFHQPFNLNSVLADNSYEKIIVFGAKPSALRMQLSGSLNTPVRFAEKEFLFTSSLEDLNNDSAKKKALVEPLRKLFNV